MESDLTRLSTYQPREGGGWHRLCGHRGQLRRHQCVSSLMRSSLPLATLLSDRVPEGLEDVSKYANLFSSLYASGNWTLLDLKKLAGLNFLRVWREVEKVRDSQISTNIFSGFQHDSKKLLESKPIFNWLCDNLNEENM